MPISNGIFYERQRGGLCRLHSINGFFGEAKITTQKFHEYSEKLDQYIKNKFHEESHCLRFDSVSSDHNILVNFILKHYGVYSRYLHINSMFRKPKEMKQQLIDLKGDYIFIYNSSHIWGARRKNNQWYKVDSLSGVHRMNINSLSNTRNIGFLIPVVIKKEFFRNVKKIQDILKRDISDIDIQNKKTLDQIENYLEKLSKEYKILGDLEIPLGVSMDILDVVYSKYRDSAKKESEIDFQKREFGPIEKIINIYDEFLFKFTPSRYHDYNLKKTYLPSILLILLKLNTTA